MPISLNNSTSYTNVESTVNDIENLHHQSAEGSGGISGKSGGNNSGNQADHSNNNHSGAHSEEITNEERPNNSMQVLQNSDTYNPNSEAQYYDPRYLPQNYYYGQIDQTGNYDFTMVGLGGNSSAVSLHQKAYSEPNWGPAA